MNGSRGRVHQPHPGSLLFRSAVRAAPQRSHTTGAASLEETPRKAYQCDAGGRETSHESGGQVQSNRMKPIRMSVLYRTANPRLLSRSSSGPGHCRSVRNNHDPEGFRDRSGAEAIDCRQGHLDSVYSATTKASEMPPQRSPAALDRRTSRQDYGCIPSCQRTPRLSLIETPMKARPSSFEIACQCASRSREGQSGATTPVILERIGGAQDQSALSWQLRW